jgi:hypothetical protein
LLDLAEILGAGRQVVEAVGREQDVEVVDLARLVDLDQALGEDGLGALQPRPRGLEVLLRGEQVGGELVGARLPGAQLTPELVDPLLGLRGLGLETRDLLAAA